MTDTDAEESVTELFSRMGRPLIGWYFLNLDDTDPEDPRLTGGRIALKLNKRLYVVEWLDPEYKTILFMSVVQLRDFVGLNGGIEWRFFKTKQEMEAASARLLKDDDAGVVHLVRKKEKPDDAE